MLYVYYETKNRSDKIKIILNKREIILIKKNINFQVKMTVRPSRSSAVKFMTATPAPPKRQQVFGNVEKENIEEDNVDSKSTKRKLSMSFDDENDENSPKKLKIETEKAEERKSFEGNQLVTGDLGRFCSIM